MVSLQSYEALKRQAQQFGGIQYALLEAEEVKARLCAARWCGNPGIGQVIDAEGYRVLCAAHMLRLYLVMYVLLGNPMYIDDAQRQAKALGIEWSAMLRDRPLPEPIAPEEFRCILCGGQMTAETVGMFSGRRWVHTCGEAKRGEV